MNRIRMDSKTSTEFTHICGLLFMLPTQVSVAMSSLLIHINV